MFALWPSPPKPWINIFVGFFGLNPDSRRFSVSLTLSLCGVETPLELEQTQRPKSVHMRRGTSERQPDADCAQREPDAGRRIKSEFNCSHLAANYRIETLSSDLLHLNFKL
jgi:hypothetical protein